MRGLVPRIHAFQAASKTWMAGTSPAMTNDDVGGFRDRMDHVVGGLGRGFGVVEIDEHGGAAGGAAGVDVALAVTHHEAGAEVDAELARRREDHAGLGLAAVAVLVLPVKAGLDDV